MYGNKRKVCLEQNISIGSHCMELGHFMLHFTTFHNVSMYVNFPQKLVMWPIVLVVYLSRACEAVLHMVIHVCNCVHTFMYMSCIIRLKSRVGHVSVRGLVHFALFVKIRLTPLAI